MPDIDLLEKQNKAFERIIQALHQALSTSVRSKL